MVSDLIPSSCCSTPYSPHWNLASSVRCLQGSIPSASVFQAPVPSTATASLKPHLFHRYNTELMIVGSLTLFQIMGIQNHGNWHNKPQAWKLPEVRKLYRVLRAVNHSVCAEAWWNMQGHYFILQFTLLLCWNCFACWQALCSSHHWSSLLLVRVKTFYPLMLAFYSQYLKKVLGMFSFS